MKRSALALLPLLCCVSIPGRTAAGADFQVNTYTTGHQYAPAAAFDAVGNFVVTWSSSKSWDPFTGYFDLRRKTPAVMAQRYAAGGARVGAEFMLNPPSLTGPHFTNLSGTPIAMRPDGRFVVVWTEVVGEESRVAGRLFEADGRGFAGFGADRSGSQGHLGNAAIAPHGVFVVVWASNPDGNPEIQARLFDQAAVPLGPSFRVNAATPGVQTQPRVAMDAAGAFVVVWQDRDGRDGSGHGVFAQMFDPAGQRLGAEFQVNTYTTGNQYAYSVARAPDGRFVVAWDSEGDGDGFGVFAQRYDATGAPMGGEFQVNSFTTGGQSYATIAVDDSFRMAAAWQSTTADGSGFGIRARRFDEQGAPVGVEFLVNTYTTRSQQAANAAIDAGGNLLVVWHSDRQEVHPPFPANPGDDLGVYGQWFQALQWTAAPDADAVESSDSKRP